MKNLKVTVNGKSYDVQVEEVSSSTQSVSTPSNITSQPSSPAPAPTTSAPSNPTPAAGSGEPIDCPMPGTILDIKVSNGQKVAKGQTILILEAMKMENEIVSPRDAVITDIKVSKGQNVDSGTPLVFIS